MRRTKIATLLATAALLAAGALATAAAPAGAVAPRAQGSWPIILSGCHISEQVQLQGSPKHDYMRWVTTGNSKGCKATIIRNGSLLESRVITTTGSDASAWYYDGPGYTMQVCVYAPNLTSQACGPQN